MMAIRLVIFDALHTLLKPRRPIYVQYSQTFEPYLGVLEPEALKNSFKTGAFVYNLAIWTPRGVKVLHDMNHAYHED